MFDLHHELSVLSRAVHFGNLSSAAIHVGLSQPQLSRIVSRIENHLKITLLDRTSRRKSHWTPIAHRLTEIFSQAGQKLEKDLKYWIQKTELTAIQVGSLEGLLSLALQQSHYLLQNSSLQILELDIFDLSQLDELFLNGDLHLIFTSRPPGRRKYKFEKEMGFQSLKKIKSNPNNFRVLSTFEFGREHQKIIPSKNRPLPPIKSFISNSLETRKQWLKHYGGTGLIPSEVFSKKPEANAESVLMIGSDHLPQMLWEKLTPLR